MERSRSAISPLLAQFSLAALISEMSFNSLCSTVGPVPTGYCFGWGGLGASGSGYSALNLGQLCGGFASAEDNIPTLNWESSSLFFSVSYSSRNFLVFQEPGPTLASSCVGLGPD